MNEVNVQFAQDILRKAGLSGSEVRGWLGGLGLEVKFEDGSTRTCWSVDHAMSMAQGQLAQKGGY